MKNNYTQEQGSGNGVQSGVSFQEKGYAFGQAVQIAAQDMQLRGSYSKPVSNVDNGQEFKLRVKMVYKLILEVRAELRDGEDK